jgi:hypothetical protein
MAQPQVPPYGLSQRCARRPAPRLSRASPAAFMIFHAAPTSCHAVLSFAASHVWPTMKVWKSAPQSGKRVPARRARPIATPACFETRGSALPQQANMNTVAAGSAYARQARHASVTTPLLVPPFRSPA